MVAVNSISERNGIPSTSLVPEAASKEQKPLILVPFEIDTWSPRLLESAVNLAETKGAELVLLCVRPPAKSMANTQEENERHFSALKSLQAQLWDQTIPVRIETVVGPIAQFVLDYADQNEGEMFLIPGHPDEVGPSDNELLWV